MGSIVRLVALALVALGLFRAPARAATDVDLALVLAVDVSFSMDPDEQALQRDGFIQAFRSPVVQDAIRRGMIGRIAVTYMEWAGSGDQRVLVPWMVVDGPESAAAFADELAKQATRRASRTSISGALEFAAHLFDGDRFEATRKVIDVSGDGPNNQGRPVGAARADALAKGITINGLPIMFKEPGYFDIANLDLYYRDCVIGGPGAFMVPAREREQFVESIKTKIIMEVAGRAMPGGSLGGLVIPVQAAVPATDCLVGENRWRDRMGN